MSEYVVIIIKYPKKNKIKKKGKKKERETEVFFFLFVHMSPIISHTALTDWNLGSLGRNFCSAYTER